MSKEVEQHVCTTCGAGPYVTQESLDNHVTIHDRSACPAREDEKIAALAKVMP